MDRAEILNFLMEQRAELRRRFGVTSLALFGSVARDEAGPESDIDILVEFRETPGLREYMDLKFWLEERLGRKVDLVMRGALKAWARPVVEAESILVA
ncbi:MAG: nucleotidyltransferase family protein [Thermoanaerobaculia bacterium]